MTRLYILCTGYRVVTVRSFLPVGTWDCYHGIRRRIQGSVWIVGGVLCSSGGGDIGLRYVCNWLVRIFMVRGKKTFSIFNLSDTEPLYLHIEIIRAALLTCNLEKLISFNFPFCLGIVIFDITFKPFELYYSHSC